MSRKTEILLILLFDLLAINLAWVVHYYLRVESGIIPYTLRPAFLLTLPVVAQGVQVIYDHETGGYKKTTASMQHEFSRKVRIGIANFLMRSDISYPRDGSLLHFPRGLIG